MTFKIIAIKPLDGIGKHNLKNLNTNQFYFFDQSYQQTEGGKGIEKNKNLDTSLPPNFFYSKKEESSTSLKYVNFQAIVGRNGDGKSTLVDLLLRTINNLSYTIIPKRYNQLLLIDNLNVELYIEISGEISMLRLTQVDNNKLVEICDSLGGVKKTISESDYDKISKDVDLENILFYSLGINYSLYAWNANDYKDDVNKNLLDSKDDFPLQPKFNWLNRIFHKNDGYLVPIGLQPYREEGIINVNREIKLSKQRVINLCLNNDLNFKKVNDSQFFHSLSLESIFNVESGVAKLIESAPKTFYSNEPSTIFLVLLNVLFIKRDHKIDDILKFFDENEDRIVQIIEHINENISVLDLIRENSDETENSKFIETFYKKLGNEISGKQVYYDTTLQRIEKLSQKFKDLNLIVTEKIFKLGISWCIIRKNWLEKVSKIEGYDPAYVFNDNLLDYLTYKSISCAFVYPEYKQGDFYREFIMNTELPFPKLGTYCRDLVSSFENRSHVNSKIFQCLNLLCNYNNIPSSQYEDFKKNYSFPSNQAFEIDLEKYSELLEDIWKSMNKDGKSSITKEQFFSDYTPSPIFKTGLNIISTVKEITRFEDLSSGEKQLIYVLSSIIYQLKNIDSANVENQFINYDKVNVILDEIELYFHPEYQREFINRLLLLLEEVSFKNIKAINISMITHSPFVLSDIPSQNVLKLKGGLPFHLDPINSFGANIHDMLADEFFLKEDFIGKFASKKIDQVVTNLFYLNKIKSLKSDIKILEDREDIVKRLEELLSEFEKEYQKISSEVLNESDMETIIDLIGEPILKSKLREMFFKYYERS